MVAVTRSLKEDPFLMAGHALFGSKIDTLALVDWRKLAERSNNAVKPREQTKKFTPSLLKNREATSTSITLIMSWDDTGLSKQIPNSELIKRSRCIINNY